MVARPSRTDGRSAVARRAPFGSLSPLGRRERPLFISIVLRHSTLVCKTAFVSLWRLGRVNFVLVRIRCTVCILARSEVSRCKYLFYIYISGTVIVLLAYGNDGNSVRRPPWPTRSLYARSRHFATVGLESPHLPYLK